MEGFLKELTSSSMFARNIRAQYLFKVVPMINPDGVVRGNYRFSAAGYDLNRRWKNPSETSHP
jgi:cytosolic carboxypeptidase protein 2/3